MTAFDLSGQVAVITGSSRGIGFAIANLMATYGATVIISSRKKDACDLAAAKINAAFDGEERAVAIAASLSDQDQLAHLIAETRRRFGRIDCLVCNAASNPYYGPLLKIDDDRFSKIINNNVMANIRLSAMVVPSMRERRSGSIIIISSIGALMGSDMIGAYNISKAADLQLVRNLAVELGDSQITVNAILPGAIRTDFSKALWENNSAAASLCKRIPLGRIGAPEDIAGATVFLASSAGRYMTGQSIIIDGGAAIAGLS